jgi:ribosome-associated protein
MKQITFTITGEFIELNRLLKATRICFSGGEAGMLSTSGAVKINRVIDFRKRAKIRKGDTVEVNGTEIIIE